MNVTDAMIVKFYNSRAWKALRQAKLNKNPLCQACLLEGRIVTATQVHHSLSIRRRWDDRFDFGLLFALCDSCHSITTQEEKSEAGHQFDEALRKAEG